MATVAIGVRPEPRRSARAAERKRAETARRPAGLDASIAQASAALLRSQRPDATWETDIDLGAVALAMQLVVEKRFGVLSARDAAEGARALTLAQQADGSTLPYPHAAKGTLTATATAYAGLISAGPRGAPALERARGFIERTGGFRAVENAFRSRGDMAAIFLLLAGCIEADFLPRVPLSLVLAPIDRLLDRSTHAGNVATMMTLIAVADRHHGRGGLLRASLRALERTRVASYICEYQNPNGGWNDITIQTLLMLVGLDAIGLTANDPRVARALAWLNEKKRYTADGLAMSGFGNDLWSTALASLALRESGVPASSPLLEGAIDALIRYQIQTPQRRHLQRKPDAKRSGGWPFERGNETMPDTDDTGVVLAALGAHARARPGREILGAIDRGLAWLRDMQNADGGWPGFTWGMPSKKPGPMFTTQLGVGFDDPRQILKFLLEPPPEYGDPSTEGNTGRVLWGLGTCGVERDDPAVCRAIEFLKYQQCESGAWWGRWKTCYVPDTATVLLGLAAVGEDPRTPYVARAIEWLLAVQNRDGGWGETPEAYVDASQAGRGPSMPPLTGYVLAALAAFAIEPYAALDRAATYLVQSQRTDGGWPNAGWLHTLLPPTIFYVYDFPAQCVPLLALAKYRGLHERRRRSR